VRPVDTAPRIATESTADMCWDRLTMPEPMPASLARTAARAMVNCSAYARPMRRNRVVAVVALMIASGLWAAGASASTPRSAKKPASTHPRTSAPAVSVLPVISCPTTYGAGSGSGPFVPHQLPTTASVHDLSFYSNGMITVLGPAGWACGALVAADGGQKLDVYRPGKPDYSLNIVPRGTAVIEVDADYTGHLPGAEQVCALFPHSAAASEVEQDGMSCPAAPGEKRSALTDDVVKFTDQPGISGTGAGSGGSLTSVGVAVYPQIPLASDASVDISLLSCTLPPKMAALCSAILGDFLVRNPPFYAGQTSG